ncbi:MAG: DUF1403 family protein [Pseudomonadota bacterium]
MAYQSTIFGDDPGRLPQLPRWATSARAETLEDVAFRSGAALAVLDRLVTDPSCGVPVKLVANRRALGAAAATSKLEGRLAREGDLRDAYCLTPPGDAHGPDGDRLAFWRAAVRQPPGEAGWALAQAGAGAAEHVADWLHLGQDRARTHGPLAGSVTILRTVLETDSRAEQLACGLSDLVLARALSWKTLLPLTAQRLTKTALRDLAAGTPGAELGVQARLLESVEETIRQARDLTRRAGMLRSVAPKLRAKGSRAAVDLFLTEDAVAPSLMLSPRIQGTSMSMTSRAARRFCDRLVELGVARELTGRPTFRLYGL